MRTGSVLEPPNISAFVFFALLAAAAFFTATDTIMRVWTTAMHMWSWCMPVRVLCVLHVMYVQPRYNSNRTASLCTLLCVCWHCMYFVHAHVLSVCVLWYANAWHVLLLLLNCCTSTVMFKVSWQYSAGQEFLLTTTRYYCSLFEQYSSPCSMFPPT